MSAPSGRPPRISVAAAVIVDAAGRHLLVRKRGTELFMQAGGKLEAGETPRAALSRELREELGLEVDPGALELLGTFTVPAAHEPGHLVDATVFRTTAPVPEGGPRPAAEIAEVIWHDPRDRAVALAPLSAELLRVTAGRDDPDATWQ